MASKGKSHARTASTLHKVVQIYDINEREHRLILEGKLASFDDVLATLSSFFKLEKVKNYEFDDTYFRPSNGQKVDVDLSSFKTIRVRSWLSQVMSDPKSKVHPPIEIVGTKDGVPKQEIQHPAWNTPTKEEAFDFLRSKGTQPWLVIEKRNGLHYRIIGAGIESKVALEEVKCYEENGVSWSAKMLELEFTPTNAEINFGVAGLLISNARKAVLDALSVDKSSLINESMYEIALQKLGLVIRSE